MAESALALGAVGLAREEVARAVDAGCIDVQWMTACPVLAPLRGEPEWEHLTARVAERAAAVRQILGG